MRVVFRSFCGGWTRGGLHRIKQPKRTTKRYLCTSRLISYADRKAGGPSYFCRRTEYPSVERPGTVPAVVLCGSAVACSCRPSLFRVAALGRASLRERVFQNV